MSLVFHPWSWKIAHATEQLSPCAETTGLELGKLNYWAHMPRAHAPQQEKPCNEKSAHHNEEQLQPEKSLCSKEDPAQPKINKYIFFS